MSDTALITHPRNRKYRDHMLRAAASFGRRNGISQIDIGFDKSITERRRKPDGSDDGPNFILMHQGVGRTVKLFTPAGAAK